jgi:hypothetical protein
VHEKIQSEPVLFFSRNPNRRAQVSGYGDASVSAAFALEILNELPSSMEYRVFMRVKK